MRKYLSEHHVPTVGFSREYTISGTAYTFRQVGDQRTGECLVFGADGEPVAKWKLDRKELESCESDFIEAVYAERERRFREENPEVPTKPANPADRAAARQARAQYQDWSDNPNSDQ